MKAHTFLLISVSCLVLLAGAGDNANLPARTHWLGTMDTPNAGTVRVVFHLVRDDNGKYAGSVDSPDQNIWDQAIQVVKIDGNKVRLELPQVDVYYDGELSSNTSEMKGTLTSEGDPLQLNVKRIKEEDVPKPAPQR